MVRGETAPFERLEPLDDLSGRKRDFVYGGEERAALFRRFVDGPGKRVLDLGCRSGALTAAYLPGNDVIGVDIDRPALAEAARRGVKTRVVDVEESLPFGSSEFDVVVAGELLEHIRYPHALLRDVHRVLRPGGTLVGSVPNGFRLKNRLRFLVGHEPEGNPEHLHLFSPAAIRSLLAGFRDPELHFISSRFNRLGPRLMANIIVFRATAA